MEKEALNLNNAENDLNYPIYQQEENFTNEDISHKKEKEKNHEYFEIIDTREDFYRKDIEGETDDKLRNMKEMNLSVLKNHNQTVLDYANTIIETMPNLSEEETACAIIATILHDSGKLNSTLKDHHLGSVQRAKEILEPMRGRKINNLEINEESIQTILNAIERHMNHPFMVNIINGGEKYPEPENIIDKIVFDADMLANISFKNVGFRLATSDFLARDEKDATEKNITTLEQSFRNVLYDKNGVGDVVNVITSNEGKKIAENTANKLYMIFEDFKSRGVFEKIQDMFSENGTFSVETILKRGGGQLDVIKKIINEEIENSCIALKIDKTLTKYFQI